MVIRYHSLSSEALRKTQDLMGQLIPDKELNVISFKSEMLEGYTSSRKFRDSVMIGGIVTLLIVFIGLIGYTNDEVNRRRKEMAIRKINGATVKDILHIFLKDIITIALPAILLGCGIAFYISQNGKNNSRKDPAILVSIRGGGAYWYSPSYWRFPDITYSVPPTTIRKQPQVRINQRAASYPDGGPLT